MTNKDLAQAYGLSQYAIMSNFDEVDHAASLSAPPAGGNCMNWVAGHILTCRDLLLAQLKGTPFLDKDEAEVYQRGSAPLNAETSCVAWDRLQEGLSQTSKQLCQLLEALPSEKLESQVDASSFPVSVEHNTLGAFCTLFLFHEGYHAGQLGIGRRLLGKEGKLK